MEKLPKQVYSSEYRAQAVLMITQDTLSVAEVARRLSMSPKTLANWVKRVRDGNLPASDTSASAGRRVVSDTEVENSRLRREVAELRMERDILKKSAAYFASESLLWSRGDQRVATRLPVRGALAACSMFPQAATTHG